MLRFLSSLWTAVGQRAKSNFGVTCSSTCATNRRKKKLMRCNSVLQMSGSTPLSSQICIHVNCSTIQMTYIELCLESWFIGIQVSLFQCFKGWPEVIGWYLCVPTHDRLQNGVVNKHVLFLWQQTTTKANKILTMYLSQLFVDYSRTTTHKAK